MASYNKTVLVGNLTRDPELRETPTGTKVTSLGLAINNTYTKDGEKKQDVVFITVNVWAKLAEVCVQYLKKGSSVLVDGRLIQKRYEKEAGTKVSTIEVIAESVTFLDKKSE